MTHTDSGSRSIDFSQWDGKPFFEGYPEEGRTVYVVRLEQGAKFVAYGAIAPAREVIFTVRGQGSDLERFLSQVQAEGAKVVHGPPPFGTNTGGDPSEPSTGGKPGRR